MSVLSRFVAKAHVAPPTVNQVNHLPDGTSTLIFRLFHDGQADLGVLGPRTHAQYKRASPCCAVLKVVFRPGGGYPFFGVPLVELADRVVPVRDLWGAYADTLLDKLVHVSTNAERLTEMKSALVERLRAPKVFEPAAVPLVREALVQLDMQQTTLHEIARKLNVSERHLRRVFSAVVGLSPKRYARIVRFRQAVARASHGAPRWSDIAAESGYFDQAHMCADFQELAQASPTDFLRKDSIGTIRCTGS
jgi:AraC-like DNA-binding protein